MNNKLLFDNYDRVHTYLRISLTSNCNFNCVYCKPTKETDCITNGQLMTSDEIFHISKKFVEYGINKIRLTGGEPLVRRDFTDIIKKISTLPSEITMTSNGFFLHKHLKLFEEVGMRSINISLDTLDPQKFKKLTLCDSFQQVWDNIVLFVDRGFHIKLNVVTMKGVNEDEIIEFIRLTKEFPIHVRFIEFMPFYGNKWNKKNVLSMEEMLGIIEDHFEITKLKDENHDTAKKYCVDGYRGTFAFITTMSNPFCDDCNRIRLTADGKIKNCLFGKEEFDILGDLRNNRDIVPTIERAIKAKHKKMGGQFTSYKDVNLNSLKNRSMIKIGG